MAGAPQPKPEHVVQFLANARQKGIRARSWSAGLVQWMIRQKFYDQAAQRREQARRDEREAGAIKPPPVFRAPPQDPSARPISQAEFAALGATLGSIGSHEGKPKGPAKASATPADADDEEQPRAAEAR